MSTHLMIFASDDMGQSASLCHRSALMNGVDGNVLKYSPWDISGHVGGLTEVHQIYEDHKVIFDAKRGCGYWAWKPTLLYYYALQYPFARNINDGDVIIYSDVGVEFINNVNYIIDRMDQDIFLFGNMYEHAHWCKRDVVEALWPLCFELGRLAEAITDETPKPPFHEAPNIISTPWARFGKQVQASVIFFRVSDYSRKFVKEWLDWCLFEGGRLIDDSPSRLPNHPEFQEHRHDQAILTTLAYRDGLKLHWWPASYNDGAFIYERGDYPDEGIPVLFNHHRKRNHEWSNAA